jgi:RNA polymerase sigma-70 factor (ECF subfamily)
MEDIAMTIVTGTLRSADAEGLSDLELVLRARGGSVRAFEQVMRRHNRRLFRAAFSLVGSADQAEDIVQEAYVRAFTKLGQFAGPDGFATWLTTITLNEARQHIRRNDRWRSLLAFWGQGGEKDDSAEDELQSLPDDAPDPECAAANRELRRVLEKAIADLPEGFRTVFVLRTVEQMSVEETARCLGLPPPTVKTRLHRAKALLRRSLEMKAESVLPDLFPFAGDRCDRVISAVLARLNLSLENETSLPEVRSAAGDLRPGNLF